MNFVVVARVVASLLSRLGTIKRTEPEEFEKDFEVVLEHFLTRKDDQNENAKVSIKHTGYVSSS
jgi:hypothetical protein